MLDEMVVIGIRMNEFVIVCAKRDDEKSVVTVKKTTPIHFLWGKGQA